MELILSKKIMALFTVVCLLFSITLITAAKDDLPTNVKVISQSCTKDELYLTVIDLDCNEVVIICYYASISSLVRGKLQLDSLVIRTGMFVEPDEQKYVIGQDATFEEDNDQGKNQNHMNNIQMKNVY